MTNHDTIYRVRPSVKTSNGLRFDVLLLLKYISYSKIGNLYEILEGQCISTNDTSNVYRVFKKGHRIFLDHNAIQPYHFESNYNIF